MPEKASYFNLLGPLGSSFGMLEHSREERSQHIL